MARPNNDRAHLRRLRDAYARLGCVPSYSQMAKALGFKAKNAAFKLTQRLIATGHLTKTAGGRLAPGPGFFALDLSEDEVRAGFGAGGNATGAVQAQALDQLLVSRPSKTVFIKVRGESMIDVGILSGDIVIAEIDGSCTIKEFRIVGGRARLIPHGLNTRAVVPTETLNIIGVVRGIVRSYRPPTVGMAKPTTQGGWQ